MQVTVENTSGLERKMHVIVPSTEIEDQVTEKIRQTAQQVRLNGFRPGKVPLREVKRRFGDGIRQEVSSEVIQSTYGEALQQEEISPAGMPKIEDVKIEEGQDLEYTAIFEVFPEVKVAGFEGITVEKMSSEIAESDIDDMIETLQEQRMEYNDVDRASAEKDKVKVDFEGFLDGEVFEGGKAEGADVILGSGSMIPGFEEGLTGIKAGEEKELEVTFPDNYQAENLAGKEALFKIKVHSVSEPAKPELDDEFFKIFDVTEGGLEAFREEIKKNMQRELEAATKAKTKQQVMDGLDQANEVDLPAALIEDEVNRMRQEAVKQFGGGAESQIDPSLLPAEMFSDQAEKRVKLGLLVSAVVEQHELKPDDALVKEMIETMASSYEDPEQVMNFYYSNEQQLTQIQNMVLEDQLVDLVLESAEVTEKTVPYQEAVSQEPADASEETDEEGTEAAKE
ncbi:MAG: trigger factor [Gammaproteobacteria bacterium]|jgi:trigger factor|nr:trigger factor [Gammaproteobacteria bacterium]MBT4493319.1 trigger factor [Gammaproteobacteria bacterium]MBT7371756.1 trigger factor [Gammaproteobacteria bacterium]